MEDYSRAIKWLEERRTRILEGKTNCIPIPFKRMSYKFPGFEKKRYGIITASQKVGKSKLVDYMLVYEPIFDIIEKNANYNLKILYFTLEMSKDDKFYDFLCHLLFKLDNIRIDTQELKSVSKKRILGEKELELIKSDRYRNYIEKFQEIVTFIDDIKNPTGINKFCRDYALSNGTLHKKVIQMKDSLTGELKNIEVPDYFEWDDPECYYVIILDNFTNLTKESGCNKVENIEKMSKYFVTLRDQLEYHIVAVQHQAQSQEGIENRKLNILYPTTDGLGDCKMTSRDTDYILGLFSPFKYGLEKFKGYDVTKFGKKLRFLFVLEDRHSGSGGDIYPLYFDGASSVFYELPLPTEEAAMQKVYNFLESEEETERKKIHKSFITYGIGKINKRIQGISLLDKVVSLFK